MRFIYKPQDTDITFSLNDTRNSARIDKIMQQACETIASLHASKKQRLHAQQRVEEYNKQFTHLQINNLAGLVSGLAIKFSFKK